MGQEMGPTPEGLKKFTDREEALNGLEKDFEHGLSESDEEFEQEKEEIIEELGAKKGADYDRVKEINKKKKKE